MLYKYMCIYSYIYYIYWITEYIYVFIDICISVPSHVRTRISLLCQLRGPRSNITSVTVSTLSLQFLISNHSQEKAQEFFGEIIDLVAWARKIQDVPDTS